MYLTSPEEKFLINILFNEDECNDIKFNKLDYNQLVKITSNHLMLPSLFYNLKVKGYKKLVPSDFYNYLEKIFNVNFDRNQILINEVQELSEHLDKSSIEHVFLKGSANIFSKIYLNVGERMVGDIDFLINEEDRISVIKLLESIDYEDFSKYSFFENRHITRKVNPTKIFAVEGHVKLLEKHNDLIKEKTFLSNKVLSDGILVPQKKDQLIHNILNNQINDFGYKKLRVNYRSIYDVYRLSKHLDNKVIFNINKYFDTYFMMVDQLKISNFTNYDYQKNHFIRTQRFKMIKSLKFYFFIELFIFKVLTKINNFPKQIFEFIRNKNYRIYCFKKFSKFFSL